MGERQVIYDYGAYSNALADGPPEQDRHVCDVRIGGRRARLVTGRTTEGAYVAAAHWPALGRTSLGPTTLTIFTRAPDATGQRELLASLWTVQFRE